MNVSAKVAAAAARTSYGYGKVVGATKPRVVTAARYTGQLVSSEVDYRTSLPGLLDHFLMSRNTNRAASVGRIAAMVATDVMARRSGKGGSARLRSVNGKHHRGSRKAA